VCVRSLAPLCSRGSSSSFSVLSYGEPFGDPSDVTTWQSNPFCADNGTALATITARCVGTGGCVFVVDDDNLGAPVGG
jgi:hypothetical protein